LAHEGGAAVAERDGAIVPGQVSRVDGPRVLRDRGIEIAALLRLVSGLELTGALRRGERGHGQREADEDEDPPCAHYSTPSCLRASRAPATRRLSFSAASQR